MYWKEKLELCRDFYDDLRPIILSSDPNRFIGKRDVYELMEEIKLSPIELIMWDILYCDNLIFYPQYPIFSIVADFCNPFKKIVIECDGAKYHNKEKDAARDLALIREGYKVFRLTGSKIVRAHDGILEQIEDLGEYDDIENDPELWDLYDDYYSNTAYGFVQSVKDILFQDIYRGPYIHHFNLKVKSLATNRLVDFKILPDPR